MMDVDNNTGQLQVQWKQDGCMLPKGGSKKYMNTFPIIILNTNVSCFQRCWGKALTAA